MKIGPKKKVASIGGLLFEYLETNLKTLKIQSEVFADGE